jgi:soluble lytic murein transglycosylase-like protein
MQIMPETWAHLRVRYGLGADNILAGAAYLRELYDRYGSPGFLAAYNAGPTRYEDHLTTSRPLPAETLAYVADVVPLIGVGTLDDTMLVAAVACAWTEASRFPMLPERSAQPSQPS